jgi:hypothetical protein
MNSQVGPWHGGPARIAGPARAQHRCDDVVNDLSVLARASALHARHGRHVDGRERPWFDVSAWVLKIGSRPADGPQLASEVVQALVPYRGRVGQRGGFGLVVHPANPRSHASSTLPV